MYLCNYANKGYVIYVFMYLFACLFVSESYAPPFHQGLRAVYNKNFLISGGGGVWGGAGACLVLGSSFSSRKRQQGAGCALSSSLARELPAQEPLATPYYPPQASLKHTEGGRESLPHGGRVRDECP